MEKQDLIDDFSEKDEISTEFVKFDKPDVSVYGILIKIDDTELGKQYTIETNAGLMSLGNYTALNSRIDNSMIGKKIKVVYLGEKKSKAGRLYKDFKVYVK